MQYTENNFSFGRCLILSDMIQNIDRKKAKVMLSFSYLLISFRITWRLASSKEKKKLRSKVVPIADSEISSILGVAKVKQIFTKISKTVRIKILDNPPPYYNKRIPKYNLFEQNIFYWNYISIYSHVLCYIFLLPAQRQ